MKTFYNDAERYVDEMLEGIVTAHPRDLRFAGSERRAVVRTDAPVQGKVALCTGGGSGHLPVFMGYVGRGLLDGAAIGNVFASPAASQMLALTRAVHGGAGVLYLYGNYGGDVMNFDLAAEMAAEEGIAVRTVRVADDVASAPRGREEERRGVAGLFYAYKVAGACADFGAGLDEAAAVTREAMAGVRSVGVAIGPCTVPGAAGPTFDLPPDAMEIGMGIHGEAGITRGARKMADETAADAMALLRADLTLRAGDEVSVLVNSLGATPLEELYIIYRAVAGILAGTGIRIYRPFVGRYATSMEMAGFSLTIFRLTGSFKRYLDHPVWTPFVKEGGAA
jgi:dihydroxyacetone kinase